MAVDTPATIAILGAGPIGLEAALYARYLGYEVRVYERGRVAEHLCRWGHVRLFTPFGHNASPLGRAALVAQDPDRPLSPVDALLTGRELVDTYYQRLAESDLLDGSIELATEVLSVGRTGLRKHDLAGLDLRADFDFRLLLRDRSGRERVERADVVIDATGTFGQPCWLGAGGIAAIGERDLRERIEYGLPDVLGAERERYAGRRTLVVGSGHSAATTVVHLARLAEQSHAAARETKVVWVTRHRPFDESTEPVRRLAGDPLPLRDELAAEANRLAAEEGSVVEHRAGTEVARIAWNADNAEFEVELIGQHAGQIAVDCLVANVGHRADREIYRELEVDESFAIEAPRAIAAQLAGEETSHDEGAAARRLVQPEPDFYLLGAKSHGRDGRFLIADGLAQIRDLFALIGDRADLNLYATAARTAST